MKIILYIVLFPLMWILLDLLYCGLITHNPFIFSFTEHILKPIGVALIYLLFKAFFERVKKRD